MPVLDELSKKEMYGHGNRRWLWLHRGTLQRYLDDRVAREDHMQQLVWLMNNPEIGRAICRNYETSQRKKKEALLKKLAFDSTLCIMLGARGAGKTALGCWIGEEIQRRAEYDDRYDRPICFVQSNIPNLPDEWKEVENIFDAPQNAIIIFDEAQMTLNARRAMSKENVEISQMLTVSRHRGNSIIFISQHSSLLDTNIMRLADCFLFKKLSWEERMTKKHDRRSMDILLEYARRLMPNKPSEFLFIDDNNRLYFANAPLPSFWTEETSKTFDTLSNMKEGILFANKLAEEGIKVSEIQKKLKMKGLRAEPEQIRHWINETQQALEAFEEWEERSKEELLPEEDED